MMFNEDIFISGTRTDGHKVAATLPACVVDDGVPSDAIDGHLVVSVDQFTFFVRAADWPELTKPHIGDIIRREDDSQFKVTRVARLGDCFSLNARSR